MCIILLQIIIYIQVVTETEEVGWVMEGTVGAKDYNFYGKIIYLLRTGFFIIIVQYYQLRHLSLLVMG